MAAVVSHKTKGHDAAPGWTTSISIAPPQPSQQHGTEVADQQITGIQEAQQ
jgi:hypothetical protein